MSQTLLDVLTRAAPDVAREQLESAARDLDALAAQLSTVLGTFSDPFARQDIMAGFSVNVLTRNPPLSPEFLAWANERYTDDEIIAGVEEIRATGGRQLKDFIHEIDKELGL